MKRHPQSGGNAQVASSASVVSVGEEYVTTAIRINDDGDGVANIQGLTVFIPHLLPGETATVRVAQVERRFARAEVVDRQDSSEFRDDAPCAVFGTCGGCQLQHVAYAEQLRHKQSMVEYALRKQAKLPDVLVKPTIGMAHPYRYRNQVQIPLTVNPDGILTSGFFARLSHEVVTTETCALEPVEMEETIERTVGILRRRLVGKEDAVHHLIVRQSYTTGEQMVVFCVRQPGLDLSDVIGDMQALPYVVSIAKTVQPKPNGPVWGDRVDLLWGKPHLIERMGDLEYLISPRSFFQVNTAQARALYDCALAYADIAPDDAILDAYCGTGTMSLMFAQRARSVIGIESVKAAIEDAQINAEHNGMYNAEFIVGEVETELPQLLSRGVRFDVVVLDPPRKGCHPDVLDAVIQSRPKRIVYVSCNHATLARDLRILVDGGYVVREAQPVDMFPQTSHVECCSLLIRKDVAP